MLESADAYVRELPVTEVCGPLGLGCEERTGTIVVASEPYDPGTSSGAEAVNGIRAIGKNRHASH
jgi:hypothetical protein